MVKTSLATGYNQWFTNYHHRDTERTEDSQRTRLFHYPRETAKNQKFYDNSGEKAKALKAEAERLARRAEAAMKAAETLPEAGEMARKLKSQVDESCGPGDQDLTCRIAKDGFR